MEGAKLLMSILENDARPLIFGGDLNSEPTTGVKKLISSKLIDSFLIAPPSTKLHCGGGDGRIDYIFFRGLFQVQNYMAPCTVPEGDITDHPIPLVNLSYSGPGNESWLQNLYKDLLNRQPDQGGLNNWLNLMSNGTLMPSVAGWISAFS